MIVEEGDNPKIGDNSKNIAHRINNLYYNNGATPMISKNEGPIIGYGQGKCVGGSTFINAGYFSLTSEEIFNQWYKKFSLEWTIINILSM